MEVIEFNSATFANALANDFTPKELIENKGHFNYLLGYLSSTEINAVTIVVENDYISKDYIQDYSFYYSLCFKEYPNRCKRIHFFSSKFDKDVLKLKLTSTNTEDDEFWKSYLGFIVVKPIPSTIIGFTILKTYGNNNVADTRNFFGIRKYNVHLFGRKIKIKSLAFQEQDSVLAACATTAIWSMLSKAALDYHTILKSPSQITQDAGDLGHDGSRLFPNKGLNVNQICNSILNSGLATEVKPANMQHSSGYRVISTNLLKEIVNAYSQIGIPIILIIVVPYGSIQYGWHAIAVSGIKQKDLTPLPVDITNVAFASDRIEKFYAHDDQFGPFVRIECANDGEIITPWTDKDNLKRPTLVGSAVISIYPKIRISYEDIKSIVLGLDRVLSTFFNGKISNDLVWDIKLKYSESFKEEIKGKTLQDDEKLPILTKSLPKYIWVADCYIGTNMVFSFTFDATDLINGMIGLDVLIYFDGVKDDLRDFLVTYKTNFIQLFQINNGLLYYDFIISRL